MASSRPRDNFQVLGLVGIMRSGTNEPDRNTGGASSGVVFWLLIAVGVGLLLAYAGRHGVRISDHEGGRHPGVGMQPPHFALEPLTGDAPQINSLADVRGQVVLVDFWGTWCPPCVAEYPELLRLAAKYRDEPRFRMAPVSVPGAADQEISELRDETESFLRSLGSQLPTYRDPELQTFRAVQLAGQIEHGGFPTTVLLRADGRIAGLWEGATHGKILEIDRMVEALLQELPSAEE